ncbi:MAG: phosphodiesterase [Humibacillus sp.]|nr:phosphodiesterase [Humibacillus sp.]
MASSPTLLRVDSSIRSSESSTREIADTFERHWRQARPDGRVVRRDVGLDPLPYLTAFEHAAMFVPVELRTPEQVAVQAAAAALADELFEADDVLLCAPLYNLGIPAGLKTWLDHLYTDIRLFPGFGITRPLAGRTCVVISARGGAYGPGTPRDGWDYEEPYVRRHVVDILGMELSEIFVDLTLAHLDPSLGHLVGIAEESRAGAHRQAEQVATLAHAAS